MIIVLPLLNAFESFFHSHSNIVVVKKQFFLLSTVFFFWFLGRFSSTLYLYRTFWWLIKWKFYSIISISKISDRWHKRRNAIESDKHVIGSNSSSFLRSLQHLPIDRFDFNGFTKEIAISIETHQFLWIFGYLLLLVGFYLTFLSQISLSV